MREIKFRAWDKEDCKWLVAEPIYGFFPELPIEEEIEQSERYSEIQQFTGLKDRNGKEIYEGDLVRMWGRVDEKICLVKWLPEHCSYYLSQSPEDLAGYMLLRSDEVIGNIYETPDLLAPGASGAGTSLPKD